MICKHCGCDNLEGTTICVFCGEPMEKPDASVSRIMTAFAGEDAPDAIAMAEAESGEQTEGGPEAVSSLNRLLRTDADADPEPDEGENRVAFAEAHALMYGSPAPEPEVPDGDLSEQAARIVEQAVERIVSGRDAEEEAGEEASSPGDPLAMAAAEASEPQEAAEEIPQEPVRRRTPVTVPPSPLDFTMEESPAEEEKDPGFGDALFVKTAALSAAAAAAAAASAKAEEAAEAGGPDEEIPDDAVPAILISDDDGAPASAEASGDTEAETDVPVESGKKSEGSGGSGSGGGGNTPSGKNSDGRNGKKRFLPILLAVLAIGAAAAAALLLGGRNNPNGTAAQGGSGTPVLTTTEAEATQPAASDTLPQNTTEPAGETTAPTEKDTEKTSKSTTEAPATEPTTEAPATTEAPSTTETPTTEAPTTTAEPTTEAPTTTAEPTTEAPTTTAVPTTEAPTTTATPTTEAPTTTAAPTTEAPTTEARERNPFYYLAQAKAGDVIRFGAYDQDGAAGKEAVEWIVLAKSGTRLLVISRVCFVTSVYSSAKPAVWATSTARSFLNGAFLNNAFSAAERANILRTSLSTPANPQSKQSGGPDTADQVFLLSIQEVQQYMSASQISATATPTARSGGAYIDGGEAYWWLRSAGESAGTAAHTRRGGTIDFAGETATVCGALRPAMWLNADQSEYLP